MDENKVTVVFEVKEGVTKDELVQTLSDLTFVPGMSYLEEILKGFEVDKEVYLNA